MRQTLEQKKQQHATRQGLVLTALAIIAVWFALSTTQPIPTASCTVNGYMNGSDYTFNQC